MTAPTHVAASAAAREIEEARRQMKAARTRATSLNAIGRSIERELAKFAPAEQAALLLVLRDTLTQRLENGSGQ